MRILLAYVSKIGHLGDFHLAKPKNFRGSAPTPVGGAYSAPPKPPSCFPHSLRSFNSPRFARIYLNALGLMTGQLKITYFHPWYRGGPAPKFRFSWFLHML